MPGVALALGSRVALAAAAFLCAVLAVRTALEDRTLQEELEGYAEYAARVKFKILPGVW
jgi:protein-S-isoprenylcysteine O-methyltransferase Ste14